jgi:light-regulated signal transduction histidine kinase (bacteriophytochrome)
MAARTSKTPKPASPPPQTNTHGEVSNSSEDFGQFAYIVSHNLKEPLREVSIFAERLHREHGDSLDARGKEGLSHVLAGVQRISEILDDLFLFSQVDSWKLNPEQVDLKVLLGEVWFNLNTSVRESGASITCGDLPMLPADRAQLLQLFEQLIGNAIKFRSQEPPRIQVSSKPGVESVVIAVQDNGIGIDRSYHEVIFKLFKRLHTRERYSGNGVGLAICRKIAGHHAGKIWVESSPGQGATFYLKLPTGKVAS